jgi:hypothetical protein
MAARALPPRAVAHSSAKGTVHLPFAQITDVVPVFLLTSQQLQGKRIPHVEAGHQLAKVQMQEPLEPGCVKCNIIMMSALRGRRMLDPFSHSQDTSTRDSLRLIGEGVSQGQRIQSEESQMDKELGVEMLRFALKSSQHRSDDDDADDDVVAQDAQQCDSSLHELKGLGIQDLTRRMNLLLAQNEEEVDEKEGHQRATQKEGHQRATQGIDYISYFNNIRFQR